MAIIAAGGIPNFLYRVPFSHLFMACPLVVFVFVSVFRFHALVEVPLYFPVQQTTYRVGNRVYS